MQAQSTSFFDGLSAHELEQALGRLVQRRFPAGSVLLAEGDRSSLMYVIRAGTADILIRDRQGATHRINSVGPGDTLGEMSLFTGEPVSATVQATSDVDALVLSETDLQRLVVAHPALYRNLGAILSERLARSNRRALHEGGARATLLLHQGGPPLLGYALACSIAWHSRRPTVLLRISAAPPPDDLASLGVPVDALDRGLRRDYGAVLLLAEPVGDCAPDALARTVEQLRESFDYALVEWYGEEIPPGLSARVLRLMGPRDHHSGPDNASPEFQAIRAWADPENEFGADRWGRVRVPMPEEEELRHLREGVLPTHGPAGRCLGWAARDLAGLKVGLALGAGSVKGYAHIGVLKVLERVGVPVDCLSGTSIGAAVAATYNLGYDIEGVAGVLDHVGSSAFRLTIPTSSLLSISGVRAGVQRIGGATCFEDLPRPLGVVAADIASGREIVFTSGLLWPAVLASMSIPGIYPPQRIGHHVLVDGGVLNPVPSDVAARLGADTVIAVKLASRADTQPYIAEAREPNGKSTSVVQAITRSIEMMQGKIVTDTAAAATIQIEPGFSSVGGWGLRSFTQGRRYIELGEAAAEEAMPRIEAALPWLRG